MTKWAIVAIVVMIAVLMSGCEAGICREADREVRRHEACIDDPSCVLNLAQHGNYDHFKRQQANRCEGVKR